MQTRQISTSKSYSSYRAKKISKQFQGTTPFKTFINLYKNDWRNLALSFFFFVIKHSPAWLLPFLTANMIDALNDTDKHAVYDIWINGAILFGVLVIHIPTANLYVRYRSIATRGVEAGLRSALARRIQMLSISYYNRTSLGKLQAKALRDVEVIQVMTAQVFTAIPGSILSVFIALGVTAMRAPGFLLFFVMTVPVAVFVMLKLRTSLVKHNRDFRLEMERMSTTFLEMLQLVPVTRAHAAEDEAVHSVEMSLDNVYTTGLRLDIMNNLFGASAWVVFRMFDTMCLVTAATMAYWQLFDVSVGEVVLLTGYFTALTNSVMNITTIVPEVTKGFESIASIAETLESDDLEHNKGKPGVETVKGAFKFEHVSFVYPSGTHSVTDVSLEVEKGETIAFVGPSGAGKSTLLNLVIGLIRPTSGRILLDGKNMNDIDLRTYRHYISVVPQDTILFTGSIRDNILYGLPRREVYADEAQLIQTLKDANIWDFVNQLPEGLETIVGERGARLSGGQRQRIAIARALVRNPIVLILDEATSALDAESERLIQGALSNLMRGRTTFVVAHRLSTVRNADRIIVLDEGRIIQTGTHDTLMHQDGMYANLVKLQM